MTARTPLEAELLAALSAAILTLKFALLSTSLDIAKDAMVRVREWEALISKATVQP